MADPAVSSGSSGRGSSKSSSSPSENYCLARRRTLQVAVSALLTESGFESAEKAAVETLTEMMQSYITEIGRCAKAYCEHTARSVPTLSDAVVTLIEMGLNVDTLPVYAKRSQRMVITAPPVTNPPVTPKALTAGQKRTHPAHIPSHFPDFPDPHTYIKTPVRKTTCVPFGSPCPITRWSERRLPPKGETWNAQLTRFMAKTGETETLFKDDVTTFPLIAAKPSAIPYLSALLPSELELQSLEETDSSEQDDQTDSENVTGHNITDDPSADKENSLLPPSGVVPSSKSSEENMIDNPYLRPVKKPKVRRKK
ncbi:hypothetical protein NQD34_005021 [Periophthalmus magnuspinnatus]|nr:hypothetical protein NQD34_005021 [Periophthalmus magnuspinnatus]